MITLMMHILTNILHNLVSIRIYHIVHLDSPLRTDWNKVQFVSCVVLAAVVVY